MKTQIEKIASYATPTGITLLRTLRQAVSLSTWDNKHTIWANGWGLVKVKDGKLWLTARGKKVADLLCLPT